MTVHLVCFHYGSRNGWIMDFLGLSQIWGSWVDRVVGVGLVGRD